MARSCSASTLARCAIGRGRGAAPSPSRVTTRVALSAVLLVALAAGAWADFDVGMAAYDRGDYQAALKEWRPLARLPRSIDGDTHLAQHLLGVAERLDGLRV